MAILILSGTLGLAYINCDPMIAGSEPTRVAALDMQPMLAIPAVPAPAQPAPAEPQGAADANGAAPAPINDGVLRGQWALRMNISLLEQGVRDFQKIDGYSFTFSRQERVGGDLLSPQVMSVKLRHQPFSLYMKWTAGDGAGVRGRQLIYRAGQDDDKLLILPGGLPGRISGTLKLSMDDGLVTRESRHPVTQCGLLNIANKVLPLYRDDLARGTGYICELHDKQTFNERDCYLFQIAYDSKEQNATYRKSLMYIDKELHMPVCIRNYTWGIDVNPEKIDEETLLEAYSFTEIDLGRQIADKDFERTSYRMK